MVYNIDLNGIYEFFWYLNGSHLCENNEEDNFIKREKNSAWREICLLVCTSIETLFTNVYFFGGVEESMIGWGKPWYSLF